MIKIDTGGLAVWLWVVCQTIIYWSFYFAGYSSTIWFFGAVGVILLVLLYAFIRWPIDLFERVPN